MHGGRLSVAEKLLVAAIELRRQGKTSFSAEDLVVAAWQKFPTAFGLRGHVDDEGKPVYPDSNRVYAEIMGSKPLRKLGLIRRVGNKMYALTEAGRSRALSLEEKPPERSSGKLTLPRETTDQIHRLFDSKAAQKYRNGNMDDISFFDACGFWGISARSSAKDLWSKFADIEAVLSEAHDAILARNGGRSHHGSVMLTTEDITRLQSLHRDLRTKFIKDVKCIEKRTDERK